MAVKKKAKRAKKRAPKTQSPEGEKYRAKSHKGNGKLGDTIAKLEKRVTAVEDYLVSVTS